MRWPRRLLAMNDATKQSVNEAKGNRRRLGLREEGKASLSQRPESVDGRITKCRRWRNFREKKIFLVRAAPKTQESSTASSSMSASRSAPRLNNAGEAATLRAVVEDQGCAS